MATHTHVCTARANGAANGQLLLPNANPDDSVSMTINSVEFQVKFGNLFDAESPNWIPVIPNFSGGILREELSRRTGLTYTDYVTKCQLVETGLATMPHAILYVYDKTSHRLESEFEELAGLCPEGSILVFPTIGVNNGLSFHKSAFNMFYSFVSCLEDETPNMSKLSKIIIMTLFNADQDNGGTRTIRHLFNLVNVYNKTSTNKMCAICASNKVETILSCGHYIMCSRCVIDIRNIGNICPICKKPLRFAYPCYTTEDAHEHMCCQEHANEKEMKICVPCGHFNVACHDCGQQIETTKKCLACGLDVFAYLPYYDS